MAVVYRASLKTTRMQAVVTDIGASGLLKLFTASGGTLLATLVLSAVAGVVAGDTLTFNPISPDPADANGVATYAEITRADGTVIISGLTVGGTAEGTAAGKNIVLAANTLSIGVEVRITSGTITHG